MHVRIPCIAPLLALTLLVAISRTARAQDPTPGAILPTDGSGPAVMRKNNLVGVPVVVSTPMIGFAAGAAGALLIGDTGRRPSALGVGGVYSTNNSWFVAVGGRASIDHDRFRAMGGAGGFSLHYDFFGIGTAAGDRDRSARIVQDGGAGIVEAEVRVIRELFIGPRYRYSSMTTNVDDRDAGSPLAELVRQEHRYVGSLLGGVADYDTRDHEISPSSGFLGHMTALFARDGLGSDRAFDQYRGSMNGYIPLPYRQVLAVRVSGCGTSGDAPPWELCLYGEGPDLRGYETGRYRDRALATGQVEWRIPVWRRFGAVGFYGLGEVAPSLGAMTVSGLLPSAGLGARYQPSKAHRVNVGADYAWAKSGGAFYFRIGEAF